MDFPFPLAAAAYERNVDPETGRPRIAGATGICRTPGVFLIPSIGVPASPGKPADFAAVQYDRPAGHPADAGRTGRWGRSRLPEGRRRRRRRQREPLGSGRLRGPARLVRGPDSTNPLPVLYDLPGSSPQNALENHPANQGLFSWVCLATIGFLPRVAPESCLVAVFGSAQPLSPAAPFLPLSEVLGALFAGEHNARRRPSSPRYDAKRRGVRFSITPVRNLNDDSNDGIITAPQPSRELIPRSTSPDTANDLLTLDQVLSNEQRALLGCGPFFGTRCDSGRGGIATSPFNPIQAINYQGLGFSSGGGIDLLNSEASALLHAWPGTFGTDASWATTNRELGPQPGTIGFAGSPVCTREVNGATIVLPGCRGVQSLILDVGAGRLAGGLRRRLRRRAGRLRLRANDGDGNRQHQRGSGRRHPRGRLARGSRILRHLVAHAPGRWSRARMDMATPIRRPRRISRPQSPARERSSILSRGV